MFDQYLAQIAGDIGVAKFIVANDKLLVFPANNLHTQVYFYARRMFGADSKETPRLQSAGYLHFNFNDESKDQKRRLSGYSPSLLGYDGLTQENSDSFKLSTLKEALGEHFEFE